ncbi:hypothetical protein LSUE1_G002926 [Lachnellula suecica]|uniref:Uncharacterized protein n=1 Tax=Lachnellula suecica TaxID=602035 RepID=A0A8T9CJI2_9HELO|nr:hypothetical protein LSUE1_G002926 [Lachnellula suecica]
MVTKKGEHIPYRDEPERDDAASMSSAVLLGDIDFPDEELPAYEDTPSQSSYMPNTSATPSHNVDPHMSWYCPVPDLPFSSHDIGTREIRTRFPNYSTSASTLEAMIREQASYPPTYYVQLHGTHTETRRQGNKETKDKINDFLILINITHLLTPGRGLGGKLELLPDNKRGYRGTRFPSLNPSVSDVEEADELRAWCEKYVADSSGWKSFTLKREIRNHDCKKLEQLLRSAIQETNYRGHLSVDFPISHQTVVVYSPGIINQWRITIWIRWVFYLTFLWILSWPFLFFITSRYSVVKAIYQYADKPPGDDVGRKPTVMSEIEWYHRWESAIKRAALARMVSKDNNLSEEYRIATARADERGNQMGANPQVPSTGNAFADGAFSLLGQGLRVAEGYNNARGWGYDT